MHYIQGMQSERCTHYTVVRCLEPEHRTERKDEPLIFLWLFCNHLFLLFLYWNFLVAALAVVATRFVFAVNGGRESAVGTSDVDKGHSGTEAVSVGLLITPSYLSCPGFPMTLVDSCSTES